MTVKNHTDVTLGAAANAAVVNAPLGQLDSALADLELQFGDFVVSGGLGGTSASLVIAQPAIRAFVTNAYVTAIAQNLNMVATNDNYVDIDNTGGYHITSVANGAAAPVIFANSIRLYKAVTSGVAVTAVTDLRQVGRISGAILDWLGAWNNVKSPLNAGGAKWDNSTVDTPAMTNMLSLTPAADLMPAGTGIIDAVLASALGGFQLAGVGAYVTTLKVKNAVNPGSGAAILTLSGTGVDVSNFTLDSNQANQAVSTAPGISGSAGAKQSYWRVRSINPLGSAFQFFSTNDVLMWGCDVEGGNATSAAPAVQFTGTCARVKVIASRIDSTPGHGIMMGNTVTSGAILALNTILNPGLIGIAGGSNNNQLAILGNFVSLANITQNAMDTGSCIDVGTWGNITSGGWLSMNTDGGQRQSVGLNILKNATSDGLGLFNSGGGPLTGRDQSAIGNIIFGAGQVGLHIDSASFLTVMGHVIKNSSRVTAAQSGISISKFNPYVPHAILLIGNIGYDDQQVKTQAYGLAVAAGAGRVMAAHNDFSGNLTGSVNDLGPATYMHANMGYNPRGWLAPPGVPATGVLFLNPFNCDCTVYVAGGTLTAIGIGGLPTPAAPALATVNVGGTLVPATYYYRIAAINGPGGHTIESVETSIVVGAGTNTNVVTLTLPRVAGVYGYNIYGRTTGAEQLLVANWQQMTFTDTGAITPSGAMPGTDTTGNNGIGVTAAAPAGSAHCLRIPWGQGVKLVYTVAPTWTWFGD